MTDRTETPRTDKTVEKIKRDFGSDYPMMFGALRAYCEIQERELANGAQIGQERRERMNKPRINFRITTNRVYLAFVRWRDEHDRGCVRVGVGHSLEIAVNNAWRRYCEVMRHGGKKKENDR